tara:strand:- start:2571 stop:2756 length:186 start_codon:yes stop_codon:yes gene_type:complete
MHKAYKKGDLVTHKLDYHLPNYGIGVIVSYDRWHGLYKVWWPQRECVKHHGADILIKVEEK